MTTTTVKTIGTGGDYTTLQSWEDASPANLVTADEIWQGQCFNQEFVSSSSLLTVSGGTTDATRYKELTTYAGASFRDHANVQTNALRYNASNGAAIRYTGGWGTAVMVNTDTNFRISNLQIASTSTTGSALNVQSGGAYNADGLIVESNRSGGAVIANYGGAVKNSLIVHRGTTPIIANTQGGSTYYNCTFVASVNVAANAFTGNYGTPIVKNCAFFNCTAVKTGGNTPTYTTCYTDAASPPSGCTTVAYDTSTGSGFENITDATRDFRIKSGSALLDVGTTDATNAANDIAGTARPQGSAYDVGAWELVVATGDYATAATEAAALTDSASNLASLSATSTEATTLAHAQDAVIGRFSTIAEAMALIDSPNGGVSIGGAATEAMALTETAINAFGATGAITESASFADTHAAAFNAIVVASDAMTLAETDSAALSGGAYSATAIEAVTLSHDQAVLYGATATATESAQLAEGATNVAALGATATDAIALDASESAGEVFVAAHVAVLDLADARAVAMSAAASAAEAMALTDAQVEQLALTAALTTQILLAEISAGSGGSEVTTTAGAITRPSRDQQSTRPSRLQASGRPARIA